MASKRPPVQLVTSCVRDADIELTWSNSEVSCSIDLSKDLLILVISRFYSLSMVNSLIILFTSNLARCETNFFMISPMATHIVV